MDLTVDFSKPLLKNAAFKLCTVLFRQIACYIRNPFCSLFFDFFFFLVGKVFVLFCSLPPPQGICILSSQMQVFLFSFSLMSMSLWADLAQFCDWWGEAPMDQRPGRGKREKKGKRQKGGPKNETVASNRGETN